MGSTPNNCKDIWNQIFAIDDFEYVNDFKVAIQNNPELAISNIKGTAHVQTTIKIRETMLNFISVDLGELRLRIAVPCAVYKGRHFQMDSRSQ
jgi:hypothetical protein